MKLKVYRTKIKQQWRWRLRYDGKTIAASKIGYDTKTECVNNISLTIQGLSSGLENVM